MADFESLTERLSPAVLAVLIVVGAFVAGGVLLALGFTLIGILVALGGIPVALVAWLAAS